MAISRAFFEQLVGDAGGHFGIISRPRLFHRQERNQVRVVGKRHVQTGAERLSRPEARRHGTAAGPAGSYLSPVPGPTPEIEPDWLRITPENPPAPVPDPVPDDRPGPPVIWAWAGPLAPDREAENESRRFGADVELC